MPASLGLMGLLLLRYSNGFVQNIRRFSNWVPKTKMSSAF